MNQDSGEALVQEVVEDFDVAFDRIRAARDLRMKRRALREALGHLFTLREHRISALGEQQYRSCAAQSEDGRTTEGLVIVRDFLTHQLTKSISPAFRDAYSDIYSDQYGLLVWLKPFEMTAPPDWKVKASAKYDRKAVYDGEVAGREVGATLQAARRFLVEPTVLGPLS
jgi:hypothetical protein